MAATTDSSTAWAAMEEDTVPKVRIVAEEAVLATIVAFASCFNS